ncbi:MAG TPA: TIGR03067 domain-containing protein [Gemmataceae bacterium]|nr:TIGR03067 domain-containing protein [Gemmataceae bacterium]
MLKVSIAVVSAALLMTGLSLAGDDKKDQAAFQGKWQVESIKSGDGKEPPKEALADLIVVIKGDEMKLTVKDSTVQTFKVKLDSTKKPKAIDFEHVDGPDKGKTEQGIYKLEGEKLTIVTNDFEGGRPTEFVAKEGSKHQLIVLKKTK